MRTLDMTSYSSMWVFLALSACTCTIDDFKRLINTGQHISESCEA